MIKRQKILITGRVQGVGFRPAVYRIAVRLDLTGFIYNNSKGVVIELQGKQAKIAEFTDRLQTKDKPPLAQIKNCETTELAIVEGENKFVIKTSISGGTALSEVSADMTVCGDCLSEMAEKKDFRYRYPFINCTNCGPRYSIVKSIPYDRCNTTMSIFPMCDKCSTQYTDVTDRRFHAQPVACPECGPKVWLTDSKGQTIAKENYKVISEAVKMLLEGNILAIKGVGGFHLAVNALDEKAVRRLRERKKRDHKPFAVMAASIEKIKEYAIVSDQAQQVLKTPQSPIVLLPKKADSQIAPSVAKGVCTYGFMLCYAPLHYLLFAEGLDVLIMTSGNISDEPLICKNKLALEKLGLVADAFLMHDREIYRQVDDSIIHLVGDEPVLLRRARGYMPTPIISERSSPKDIFAAGADMKNTFCLIKNNQLICSEHIGDLADAEVYHHYVKSIEHLKGLFEVEPKVAVCDLHPGYLSTSYVHSLNGIEVVSVQHHWAHITSVLAEHNLDGPVIGLTADGTGYGTDGAIWGCECLIASLKNFDRFGHLAYYTLAGADKASKEAIRPVLGLLKKIWGNEFELDKFSWLLKQIEPDGDKIKVILKQIEKQINCVETSSLGRVFDAVAAMLGLGSYNNFDAQLPMALEAVVAQTIEEAYSFELTTNSRSILQLDVSKMIRQLVDDIKRKVENPIISAKFHNCLAEGLVAMVVKAREKTGLEIVALSGGVFCNRYLLNRVVYLLKKNHFSVLFNKDVPSNDGGIALGQAAIGSYLVSRRL